MCGAMRTSFLSRCRGHGCRLKNQSPPCPHTLPFGLWGASVLGVGSLRELEGLGVESRVGALRELWNVGCGYRPSNG